jgi:hypothetical protein
VTKLVLSVNRSAVVAWGRCPYDLDRLNSQPASRVQILGGYHDTAVRVTLPLQLRESEMFDLGSVPYKDSDELCIAWIYSVSPPFSCS